MLAYTYIKQGKFELIEKPKPELRDSRDAIVRAINGNTLKLYIYIIDIQYYMKQWDFENNKIVT